MRNMIIGKYNHDITIHCLFPNSYIDHNSPLGIPIYSQESQLIHYNGIKYLSMGFTLTNISINSPSVFSVMWFFFNHKPSAKS